MTCTIDAAILADQAHYDPYATIFLFMPNKYGRRTPLVAGATGMMVGNVDLKHSTSMRQKTVRDTFTDLMTDCQTHETDIVIINPNGTGALPRLRATRLSGLQK
jgi:hypothetical protein|mmetsp:Transcript_25450/g.45930  ORF Transcript_25450/g.45930 Transcript_25450/m.45930 type:complete len:104 (-) Transcript_25450:989-1300(-)|eukprot:CAMPEP_0202505318 /NCGR_PEP_ID=MMETSP1361-20130828/46965_1 /ASSEMBLY_ACC=CAM_ASM_000849 /TAXON_ID=210615 /ORGANISM="Staurosira complex sp., Strain CCMP2646" /LENGTH=103 /DNA_ID=CAMNT_0049139033 /DNA_START=592 /DNA_END=903 /DNA_ORIENTATION=+